MTRFFNKITHPDYLLGGMMSLIVLGFMVVALSASYAESQYRQAEVGLGPITGEDLESYLLENKDNLQARGSNVDAHLELAREIGNGEVHTFLLERRSTDTKVTNEAAEGEGSLSMAK